MAIFPIKLSWKITMFFNFSFSYHSYLQFYPFPGWTYRQGQNVQNQLQNTLSFSKPYLLLTLHYSTSEKLFISVFYVYTYHIYVYWQLTHSAYSSREGRWGLTFTRLALNRMILMVPPPSARITQNALACPVCVALDIKPWVGLMNDRQWTRPTEPHPLSPLRALTLSFQRGKRRGTFLVPSSSWRQICLSSETAQLSSVFHGPDSTNQRDHIGWTPKPLWLQGIMNGTRWGVVWEIWYILGWRICSEGLEQLFLWKRLFSWIEEKTHMLCTDEDLSLNPQLIM